MSEFKYVQEAFLKEKSLGERKKFYEKDIFSIAYRDKGIITHVAQNNDHIQLQFHGWELVLLKDGNYFINDTSGG